MSRYMGNFARPENAIKRAVRRAMERDRGTRGRPGGGGVSDGDREVFWLAAREGWVSGRVVDAF